MPSMFDSQSDNRANFSTGQQQPFDQTGVPGQSDPLQQSSAQDFATEQNWDVFNQHMLLVVQAMNNLGVTLKGILNP